MNTLKKTATMTALALFGAAFVLVGQAPAANPPTNADELVAQHLDSIATPAIRAGLKNRVAQGPVHFEILNGGGGGLDGKAVLVSDGRKFQFMVKLPNNLYHGEQIIFDGEKDKVAFSSAQQARSPFGNFVYVQDAVIHEGLLGGVISTAWPLLDLDERKAKLTFGGLKKIDGQDVYELHYRPHKNSDLEINLYFDPQTYRHVETIYSYSTVQGLTNVNPLIASDARPGPGSVPGGPGGPGTPETIHARQFQNRFRLQEKFSDFKTVDGVTLPTQDDIQFSQELQNGKTTLYGWDIKGLDVSNNAGVDPRNFEVK